MRRARWVALYALLCAVDFFVSWAKEVVVERIKAGTPAEGA